MNFKCQAGKKLNLKHRVDMCQGIRRVCYARMYVLHDVNPSTFAIVITNITVTSLVLSLLLKKYAIYTKYYTTHKPSGFWRTSNPSTDVKLSKLPDTCTFVHCKRNIERKMCNRDRNVMATSIKT